MEKLSSSSVRIISVDLEAVEQALQGYVERMKQRPEVLKVVLFGSFATGRYAPGSDADLLVVLSENPRRFLDRIAEYLPERFPVGVDVFPYTEAEIEQNAFARSALREGRVLWAREVGA